MLAWLMNLDFAGGDGSIPDIGATSTIERQNGSRRPPYGFGYGYRHIAAGVAAWLLSF